jgi:hypothetical protein
MKANELRLNNYVYDNESQDVIQIERGEHIEYISLYDPIPLTEEWLLKFGFEICGYNQLSWRHTEHIKNFELDGINWADADYPEYQFLIYNIGNDIFRIHYVHQLQNLYFALTGEELKLKEDESKID